MTEVKSYTITKRSGCEGKEPFLTIITRKYKRPMGLVNNMLSINLQTDNRWEQIFIEDSVGYGMLAANQSFALPEVVEQIKGKYVYLLDDDDFLRRPDFVHSLAMITINGAIDLIMFRMLIHGGPNGDLYPTPETWMKDPVIAHVGGSCFAVRTKVWKDHISQFGYPRCGDFEFLKSIWNTNPSREWIDKIFAETSQIGRGRSE